MATPEKPKVSKKETNTEPKRLDLLVHHEPFSYKTRDGRPVQVRGHWELRSGLSAAQKAEAQKLKAEKLARKVKTARPKKGQEGQREQAAPAEEGRNEEAQADA